MKALDLNGQMARTTAGVPRSTEFTMRSGILRSSKILDLHLDRLAIVYVRQSDPQQVLNHRESRERQYALAGRPTSGPGFNAFWPKLPWSMSA